MTDELLIIMPNSSSLRKEDPRALSTESVDRITHYLREVCLQFDSQFERIAQLAENMGMRQPDACTHEFTPEDGMHARSSAKHIETLQALYDLDVMATNTDVSNQRVRVLVALDAVFNMRLTQGASEKHRTYWKELFALQLVEMPPEAVDFFIEQPALVGRLLNAGASYEAIHMKLVELDGEMQQQILTQREEAEDVEKTEAELWKKADAIRRRLLEAPDDGPMKARKRSIAFGNRSAMEHALRLKVLLRDLEESQADLTHAARLRVTQGAKVDRFVLDNNVATRIQEDYAGVSELEIGIVRLWGLFLTEIVGCMIRESGAFHAENKPRPITSWDSGTVELYLPGEGGE